MTSLLSYNAFSQSYIKKNEGFKIEYQHVKASDFLLNVRLEKFDINSISKNGETYSKIHFAGSVLTNKKGWAELPFVNIPIQLSSDKNVSVVMNESDYVDIPLNFPLLPSRGTIYRNQNPSEIPYEIDPASIVDAWYPENVLQTSTPYIVRDVRGCDITAYPFQYNAVTNVLRVYRSFQIVVSENESTPINPITGVSRISKEMPSIYNSIFINYNQNISRWTNEIGEVGDILVIYTSRDASVIQPWITWKKQMGYNVYEQQVSTGTNVVTTVQNAYNANNNILYVLLVGDWADIKSNTGPDSAPVDPDLGCVVGSDDYHDIIIGRFSASTTTNVTTQVNKVITYERDPDASGTWYEKGLGIGGDDGSGIGDDGEIDYEQVDVIKNEKLLPFTYTTVNEAYHSPSSTTVVNYVNAGLSVINYCGHGDHDYWVTSNYSASNVNSSTNGDMLPFVFSVACIVGEFHTGTDCLAEAMLKKSGGGAVAAWMSTINQPWTPPMRGQDYANDLLVQGHNYLANSGSGTSTTYGKTRFGSITFNAAALMIAEVSTSDDWDTYQTWTIFGDPSIQVRTATPEAITLTNPQVTAGNYTTQVLVNGSPFENALVSLYSDTDDQPFSALTDASGNVSINHTLSGTVKLTVTGFNLVTIFEDKVVASAVAPVCDFSGVPTTITAGESVAFTDLSENYPSSWTWDFGDGQTSTQQNPTHVYTVAGTYDVSLNVSNTAGSDSELKVAYITVNPVSNPPIADFEANVTTIIVGNSVDFTDLSTNLPESWSWVFEGGSSGTSSVQNPTGIVYGSVGIYTVTLSASNAFGTGTEQKTAYIEVILPNYCSASSASTSYEYISNVTIGDINNTSTQTTYSDYTSSVADVNIGHASSLSVTIGTGYSSDQVLAWVDWNKDGDFSDSGEDVYISDLSGVSGTNTFTTTITPPSGAVLGTTTMRIRLHDSSYGPMSDPCGESDYGEVEDYSLNVSYAVSAKLKNENNSILVYPNPANTVVNISGKNISSVRIYNVLGQSVLEKEMINDKLSIDVSKLNKGIYIVKFESTGSEVYSKKLTIK